MVWRNIHFEREDLADVPWTRCLFLQTHHSTRRALVPSPEVVCGGAILATESKFAKLRPKIFIALLANSGGGAEWWKWGSHQGSGVEAVPLMTAHTSPGCCRTDWSPGHS